jgi:hypothetical protein
MKSTVVELILAGCVGMWLGAMMMYLMIIRPLHQENEKLKEVIHQQPKIGFYEELKQEEYE